MLYAVQHACPVGQFLESTNLKRVKSYGQLKIFCCKIQKKEKKILHKTEK
jgi:hypothetical protein